VNGRSWLTEHENRQVSGGKKKGCPDERENNRRTGECFLKGTKGGVKGGRQKGARETTFHREKTRQGGNSKKYA